MLSLPHQKIITRLAPTPSGYLHVGNALSFCLTATLAQIFDADIVLRIDDLDGHRTKTEYIDDIFFTLDWLGIRYQVGPSGTNDFYKNWSQQHRLSLYMALLNNIYAQPQLSFTCNCSRSQIVLRTGSAELYDGLCLNNPTITNQANTKIRLNSATISLAYPLPKQLIWQHASNHFTPLAYPIICKNNQLPAYQIASLADDVFFNCNLIIRGADLLSSTGTQLQIANALNISSFLASTFVHHPLITDKSNIKLSKSAGATSCQHLRNNGMQSTQIWEMLNQFWPKLKPPYPNKLNDWAELLHQKLNP